MFPREHGAYGQLLFPLATALAIGHPAPGAIALAAAAVFAFLAHEPLLVLIGQRGRRAARDERARAWRWLAPEIGVFVLCAVLAATFVPAPARAALAAPAVLALAVLTAIGAGQERSTAGELLSALALSSVALPVALASGASGTAALTVAVVFAAASVAATVCVRAVIMHAKQPPAVPWRNAGAALSVAAVALLSGLAGRGMLDVIAPWAALPACAGGCLLVAAPPPTTRLRTVGWTLVGTTVVTSAVLAAALR